MKLFPTGQLKEIEERIKSIEVPSDIGRLPMRISSNSGSYTAEQWKNWTLIYSIYYLKGILPDEHLKCWQTFVLACKYLCQSVISGTDLDIADGLILKFCKSVETLYGKHVITPNMHLHNHLKEVILDHGPITSFWCFSFERFNGIMGSTTTNKRSVELQLMRKLLISRQLKDMKLPDKYKIEFLGLCSPSGMSDSDVAEEVHPHNWCVTHEFRNIATKAPLNGINWRNDSGVTRPSSYKLVHLDVDDATLLKQVYKILYPGREIEIANLAEGIQKFGTIKIWSTTYGSQMQPRRIRSSKILASWVADNGEVLQDRFLLSDGIVRYYFKHSIQLGDEHLAHHFACMKWYIPHIQSTSLYGNPIRVSKNKFHRGGPSSLMPVQRIFSRFASAELEFEGQKQVVVAPINRNVHL